MVSSHGFGSLIAFLLPAFAPAPARGTKPLFAQNSSNHLEKTYWPLWADLFLEEGDDSYPMPPSHKVKDLLKSLQGVKGLAVKSEPPTTVTEGQGYAMFAAGMRKDVKTLKALTVAWQANGQGLADTPPCGGCGVNSDDHFDVSDICTGKRKTPCLCKTVPGAYMPGWEMPMTMLGQMGSATDGDEDAVTGIVYLAELTGSDEVRKYAVHSITAFVLEDLGHANPSQNSRPVPAKGDIPERLQTMYLWRGGTCWGGYDTQSEDQPDNRNLCINPAYFSPGQWRLFKEYLAAHEDLVPSPHSAAELGAVLESAITWGYNTLQRIACPNGLVSNWWTLPDKGWPYDGELKCTVGTPSGSYYSDASRIPWRVVLDYLWFPGAETPSFDGAGKRTGTWGAREYAGRWAGAWMKLIKDGGFDAGSYPPLDPKVTPLRKDQVIPLMSKLEKCETCPAGFTAPPWNGWGVFPVVTTFQVPIDGMDEATNQQWLDYLAQVAFDGCTRQQYFDLGQEVIVSAMLGGSAWMPLSGKGSRETSSRRELAKASKEGIIMDDDRAPSLHRVSASGGRGSSRLAVLVAAPTAVAAALAVTFFSLRRRARGFGSYTLLFARAP